MDQFRRVWTIINNLSVVAWLASLGGASVIGAVLRALTDLPTAWIVVFAVGSAMLIAAGFLAFTSRPRPVKPSRGEPYADFETEGEGAVTVATNNRIKRGKGPAFRTKEGGRTEADGNTLHD